MQRITLAVIAMAMTLLSGAQQVENCKAGQLATLVDDCNITHLEVSGHIDARDFRFIADSLRQLVELDLGATVVDAYSGDPLFGNSGTYNADEVPCLSLAGLTSLQRLVLPRRATALGDGSLAGCTQLSTVDMPAGLSRVGDYALTGCTALSTLTLTDALSHIGEGAFSHCTALQSLVISETPPADTVIVAAPQLTIGARAFAHCPALRTLDLGHVARTMGAEALADTGLEQLDLSRHTQLDSLPDWALTNSELRQLSLPSSVRSIGDGALMNVASLSQLMLPATVDYIGSYAMAYTTGLKQLESKPTEVPALGDSVWYGIDQSAVTLRVSPQSLTAYRSAQQWCNFAMASLQRGDVDGNGVVDIADVNIIINIMLGRDNADNYEGRAYVTDDSNIDIADVNAVINVMLARLLALRRAAALAAQSQQQITH